MKTTKRSGQKVEILQSVFNSKTSLRNSTLRRKLYLFDYQIFKQKVGENIFAYLVVFFRRNLFRLFFFAYFCHINEIIFAYEKHY